MYEKSSTVAASSLEGSAVGGAPPVSCEIVKVGQVNPGRSSLRDML